MPALAGVTRREQLAGNRAAAGRSVTTQPATGAGPTTRPSVVLGSVAQGETGGPGPETPTTLPAGHTVEPIQLRRDVIIQRIFDASPHMRASREEMVAAEIALEEFRTNLSRFEPYINTKGETAAYPKRLDARGSAGEVVGGIQKETFEGAILRLEGGASMSHFTYADADRDNRVDRGSGGLVRARVEVPFIGSRKRQERVISQAFQESQARKARLEYLSDFTSYVTSALEYYHLALLQRGYAEIYDQQAQILEAMLANVNLREEDRMRLASAMETNRVTRDQYRTSERTYVLLLLALLGLPMDTPFELVDPESETSPYVEILSTPEGRAAMLEEAYANNPRFRVLQDAIKDAELQKQAAIQGRYDVTAFVEGTQFPFGAVTYDDRLGGWLLGGGVNVRLNDQRVLTASRLKAEAQIRQYQAEIEAERLGIERKIMDNSDKLQAYHRIRTEARELTRKKEQEFRLRSEAYFTGANPSLTVDDVLGPLAEWAAAEYRLVANQYYIRSADLQVISATGELYQMVGMDINTIGAGATTQPGDPAQKE